MIVLPHADDAARASEPPTSSAADDARTRLVRTRTKIHKPSCPNVKHADIVEWHWAEYRSDDEWIHLGWLEPCQRCLWDLVKRQDELARRGELVTDFEEWANAYQ